MTGKHTSSINQDSIKLHTKVIIITVTRVQLDTYE